MPDGGDNSSPVTRQGLGQQSKSYATIGLKGRLRARKLERVSTVHSASLQGHILVEAPRISCLTECGLWDSAWLPGTCVSEANRPRLLLFPDEGIF